MADDAERQKRWREKRNALARRAEIMMATVRPLVDRLLRHADPKVRDIGCRIAANIDRDVTEARDTHHHPDRYETKTIRVINAENDFVLLCQAIRVVNVEMMAEGKKNMATMSPGTVAALAVRLDRLLTCWPRLPLETKLRIAKAQTSAAITSLLPNPRLRNEGTPHRVT